jgi:hypothetical protein
VAQFSVGVNILKAGTVVDATLISAPSSTKNGEGQRDPETHQTKKGNQWYFGMKAHIGVDGDSGLVHSVIGTAANVSNVTQAQALLHGKEAEVFGDAGYQGAAKRAESSTCWDCQEFCVRVISRHPTLGCLIISMMNPSNGSNYARHNAQINLADSAVGLCRPSLGASPGTTSL